MKIIYLDPGHGGKDPGATSRKYQLKEKELALEIAERTVHYIRKLSKLGDIKSLSTIDAHLTRTGDVFIGINERPKLAIDNEADIFISIHINSALSRKAQGVEAWISSEGYFRQQSNKLANKILCKLQSCGFKGRGVKNDADNRHGRLGVLRGFDNTGIAVLLEVGFLTNEYDAALLDNKKSREIISVQIATAILDFLSVRPRMDLV